MIIVDINNFSYVHTLAGSGVGEHVTGITAPVVVMADRYGIGVSVIGRGDRRMLGQFMELIGGHAVRSGIIYMIARG